MWDIFNKITYEPEINIGGRWGGGGGGGSAAVRFWKAMVLQVS